MDRNRQLRLQIKRFLLETSNFNQGYKYLAQGCAVSTAISEICNLAMAYEIKLKLQRTKDIRITSIYSFVDNLCLVMSRDLTLEETKMVEALIRQTYSERKLTMV